jgi:hypothetical protein
MVKKVKDYVSDRVFDGKRPIKGKRLEILKEKRGKELAKRFTVSVFTERGALSHKKIYEKAGYKFVSSKVTPDKVFLTFQDKE